MVLIVFKFWQFNGTVSVLNHQFVNISATFIGTFCNFGRCSFYDRKSYDGKTGAILKALVINELQFAVRQPNVLQTCAILKTMDSYQIV